MTMIAGKWVGKSDEREQCTTRVVWFVIESCAHPHLVGSRQIVVGIDEILVVLILALLSLLSLPLSLLPSPLSAASRRDARLTQVSI